MPRDDDLIRQLVSDAQLGDRTAQQALWETHRRWVAAIVIAHRPRAAEVDDLMQDVAERLVARIDTLRDAEAFRPWLRQIVLNVCRGWARRDRPTFSLDRRMDDSDSGGGDGTGGGLLPDTSQRTGDDIVEKEDAARRLLRQVDGLPPEYREPLLLRCLRSMSYQQISELLDLPVTTVETRLTRARRMLRGELRESMGFSDPLASGAEAHSPKDSGGDKT